MLSKRVEEIVVPAWPQRKDRARAWQARNDCDALCRHLATVSAVIAWAAGHGFNDTHKIITPRGRAGGFLTALRAEMDGRTLLTVDSRHEYPPDLSEEAPRMRVGEMFVSGRVLPAPAAARR